VAGGRGKRPLATLGARAGKQGTVQGLGRFRSKSARSAKNQIH